MKRIILCLLFIICIVFSLYAGDFGLDISNTTIYGYMNDWSLLQNNRAVLWVSFPLAQGVNVYLSGFYEFSGTYSNLSTELYPYRFDVGLTYLAFRPELQNMIFTIMAGRLQSADAVNSIYSGYYDGLALTVLAGNSRINFEAGYLGLLYKKDALILIDADDTAAYSDDAVYLASPRLLAMLGYRVDDLLKGFDAGFEFWSQFDLAGSGTLTHTLYYEPRFVWRIGSYFTLSGFGILSMLLNSDISLGYSYGAEFSASIPAFFRSVVSLKLYTSGGTAGDFVSFAPIRLSSVAQYAQGIYGDATALTAKVSLIPASTMIFVLQGGILLREGAVLPAGYAAGSDSIFIGSEYGAQWISQIVSDVYIALGGGVFIPNTLGAYPVDAPLEWKAVFSCGLKL